MKIFHCDWMLYETAQVIIIVMIVNFFFFFFVLFNNPLRSHIQQVCSVYFPDARMSRTYVLIQFQLQLEFHLESPLCQAIIEKLIDIFSWYNYNFPAFPRLFARVCWAIFKYNIQMFASHQNMLLDALLDSIQRELIEFF